MSKTTEYFHDALSGRSSNSLSIATLIATFAAVNLGCGSVRADSLAYSFESATNDGFTGNAVPPTFVSVTQDTIGATVGTHSLKFSVVSGGTFVGAQTSVLDTTTIGNSALIGNPPGIDHVTFDLTIPQQFTGNFAVLGMTVFGRSQDGSMFADAQFQDNEVHLEGLAPGTYTNMRMDLTSSLPAVPVNEGGSFNNTFGTGLRPDGEEKLVPIGLQFYINKSTGTPITIYLDNVRFGMTVAGDYNGNGIVDAADYTIWRDTLGSTTDLRANGDDTGASLNLIDQADYMFWKSKFGATSGRGSGALSSGAVPEPGSAVLLLIGAISWLGARQSRAAR